MGIKQRDLTHAACDFKLDCFAIKDIIAKL